MNWLTAAQVEALATNHNMGTTWAAKDADARNLIVAAVSARWESFVWLPGMEPVRTMPESTTDFSRELDNPLMSAFAQHARFLAESNSSPAFQDTTPTAGNYQPAIKGTMQDVPLFARNILLSGYVTSRAQAKDASVNKGPVTLRSAVVNEDRTAEATEVTTGSQGPAGPQGIQGQQGDQGPAGPRGADSTVAGPQGPMGEKGDKGDPGEEGQGASDEQVRAAIAASSIAHPFTYNEKWSHSEGQVANMIAAPKTGIDFRDIAVTDSNELVIPIIAAGTQIPNDIRALIPFITKWEGALHAESNGNGRQYMKILQRFTHFHGMPQAFVNERTLVERTTDQYDNTTPLSAFDSIVTLSEATAAMFGNATTQPVALEIVIQFYSDAALTIPVNRNAMVAPFTFTLEQAGVQFLQNASVIGPEGAPGEKGDTGADSTVQGPKGDKGDKGDQGEQGPEGDASTVPGPAGSDGSDGQDGAQGIQGEKGDTGPQGPKGEDGSGGTELSAALTAFDEAITAEGPLVTAGSNFLVDPINVNMTEVGNMFEDQSLSFPTSERQTLTFALGTIPAVVGGDLGVRFVLGETLTPGGGFGADIESGSLTVGSITVPINIDSRDVLQTVNVPAGVGGAASLSFVYVGRNVSESTVEVTEAAWQHTVTGPLRAAIQAIIDAAGPTEPTGPVSTDLVGFDSPAQKAQFAEKLGFLPIENTVVSTQLHYTRWNLYKDGVRVHFQSTDADFIGFLPEDLQNATITYGPDATPYEVVGSLHDDGVTYFLSEFVSGILDANVVHHVNTPGLAVVNDTADNTSGVATNTAKIAADGPIINASKEITDHFTVDESDVKSFSYTADGLTAGTSPTPIDTGSFPLSYSPRSNRLYPAVTRDPSVFTSASGNTALFRGTENVEILNYVPPTSSSTREETVWLTDGLTGTDGAYFREALGSGSDPVSTTFSFTGGVPSSSQEITFNPAFEENGNIHEFAPIVLPAGQDSITTTPILFGGRTYAVDLIITRSGDTITAQIDNKEPSGNPALANEFLLLRGSYTETVTVPGQNSQSNYIPIGTKAADDYMIAAVYFKGSDIWLMAVVGGVLTNVFSGFTSSESFGFSLKRGQTNAGEDAAINTISGFTNTDEISSKGEPLLTEAFRILPDAWFGLRTATTASEIILRTDARIVYAGQSTGGGGDGTVGPAGPQGEQGETGPAGPIGPEGPKGDQGEQGIQGIQGEPGTGSGSGTPGPKGDTGDTGPQGPQGERGERGETGLTGSAGPTGRDGIPGNTVTGPQGPKGDDGAQGIQGEKGDTGDTGPQGPAGDAGKGGGSNEPIIVEDIGSFTSGKTFMVSKADVIAALDAGKRELRIFWSTISSGSLVPSDFPGASEVVIVPIPTTTFGSRGYGINVFYNTKLCTVTIPGTTSSTTTVRVILPRDNANQEKVLYRVEAW